jgi:hypothetical protein
LVATVINTESLRNEMCLYIYICYSQYRQAGRVKKKRIKQIVTAVKAACQRNFQRVTGSLALPYTIPLFTSTTGIQVEIFNQVEQGQFEGLL